MFVWTTFNLFSFSSELSYTSTDQFKTVEQSVVLCCNPYVTTCWFSTLSDLTNGLGYSYMLVDLSKNKPLELSFTSTRDEEAYNALSFGRFPFYSECFQDE